MGYFSVRAIRALSSHIATCVFFLLYVLIDVLFQDINLPGSIIKPYNQKNIEEV